MNIDIKKIIGNMNFSKQRERMNYKYLLDNWVIVGRTFCKNYEIDELAMKYIKYFGKTRDEHYPELKDNHLKGLRVFGPKGLGKTLNLLIYQRLCKLWHKEFFRHYEMKDIEHMYKLDGAKFLDKIINIPELAISDIGTEADVIKDFGTNVNLIDDILAMRYIRFQNNGQITHITTNLSNAIYHKKYGDRHDDRANEMFINISAEGQSKRK